MTYLEPLRVQDSSIGKSAERLLVKVEEYERE
jgi:hypothetical protein